VLCAGVTVAEAALGIAAAYVLSNGDKMWLRATSALLVVHWLGDSLDDR
jgi:hypothetical protein